MASRLVLKHPKTALNSRTKTSAISAAERRKAGIFTLSKLWRQNLVFCNPMERENELKKTMTHIVSVEEIFCLNFHYIKKIFKIKI